MKVKILRTQNWQGEQKVLKGGKKVQKGSVSVPVNR